ncbi:50S ribosomal protein L22 [Candidatus Uhrbacteria bacterium CG10_big_fil_rev_8_21_14_0_10_48_11]|uniref:Large ribosomal subunit protein uL22 n=1 Tax=Candidatus Uhrbacteria bacterium CG10_big_fil_rev_8_21_14_0_10_48_11 TaxID=1975037 RepID=A0A2M8LF05_9BACT|nr:MAG: 50S ribosomal protein L22 [Candidatus Uhrbacteria bacterium CG10_big_fil_rev_8_21_14_0_10_48_11]
MDSIAKLRNLRIAPRKVRLVADLVRGRSVTDAVAELRFWQKRAATPVRKLIESAAANAEHNFKMKPDTLVVKSITVDDAATMKRSMPRAFGRATVIRKRGSHVVVVVGEVEAVTKKMAEKKEVNKKKETTTTTPKKAKRVKK